MNNRLIIIIAVVLILVVGSGYFLTKSSVTSLPAVATTPTPTMAIVESATSTPTVSPSEAMDMAGTPASALDSSSVREITVTGSNYKFDPATITVKKGDKVKIVFKSKGGFHDFVLDEFGVRTKVADSGEMDTAEFVADKIGTYEYYCSVGSHRQMGMVGKFIVQ